MKIFIIIVTLFIVFVFNIQSQTILLEEDFSTASGSTPPAGWTVQTVQGDPAVDVWRFDNPGRREPNSPIAENFACFDSDKLSDNGLIEEVYLTSPVFDATTSEDIYLEFDQYFHSGFGGECAIEVYNGSSWIEIYNNSSAINNPHHSSINITSHVQNITNAQIRFEWQGDYSWFWIVDNIKIEEKIPITELFLEISNISLPSGFSTSTNWGDYDKDGDFDLLFTGSQISSQLADIFENKGGEDFVKQGEINLSGVKSGSAVWGDFDNDNDLDILLSGYTIAYASGPISKIYQNKGNNTFTEFSNHSLINVGYSSNAWGDFDNDGDLDILLTGKNGKFYSKIYENKNNSIAETAINFKSNNLSSVSWADYDNDNDLDVLIAATIYTNNSNGFFSVNNNFNLTNFDNGSSAWGDYDNDGDLDLFITGEHINTCIAKVFRNSGNGMFEEQTHIELIGVKQSAITLGDCNNDGNLDALISGRTQEGYYSSKLYFNNGDNTFSEAKNTDLVGADNCSSLWCDFDNDNDLDILIIGYNETGLVSKLYKNNTQKKNTCPSTPKSIIAYIEDNKLYLSWSKSYDNETPQLGLTYNLRIGTSTGGCEIMSGHALSNGKRTIVDMGNVQHNTSWVINLPSPVPQKIYYSVQAIDNGFLASEWSPEQSNVSKFVADFSPTIACQNMILSSRTYHILLIIQ